MEYYKDAYEDASSEEFDPIADYSYGYESDNNSSELGRPQEEDMARDESEVSEERDEIDGSESEGEQDETYYDGEEDADEVDYHQHTSSLPSPSIYDDDASVYRDYHYQESGQVSEIDGHQEYLHQLPPPAEPSRPSTAYHRSSPTQMTDMEDDRYLLDAVPEMKLSLGLDYSDDSNHLFGYPTNHSISNSGLYRQASQMASCDADEGASASGYHFSSAVTHDEPGGDHGSEVNHTFASADRNQQQQQQSQQHFDHNSTPEHSPAVGNTSQHPDQTITFNHYHPQSNPEDQQIQAQQKADTTVTTTTTTSSNNTRPRSSFLTLPGPITSYWKRLKRGPSSSPSSSRPPYPP